MTTATLDQAQVNAIVVEAMIEARQAAEAALARKYLAEGLYTTVCELDIPYTSFDAAEEVFDLTNNPMRMDRQSRYGRARSVSVGDLVTVDGVIHLCRPTGWIVVDTETV